MKVLFVDDKLEHEFKPIFEAIQEFLTSFNPTIQIFYALSKDEALEQLRENNTALVPRVQYFPSAYYWL